MVSASFYIWNLKVSASFYICNLMVSASFYIWNLKMYPTLIKVFKLCELINPVDL